MKESAAGDGIVSIRRLGKKPDNVQEASEDYRQILVEFKTVDMKRDVLKNSSKLKNWGSGNEENENDDENAKNTSLGSRALYINQDESPLSRKENYRLRRERNRLRIQEENKGKKIVISKGKLLVDDVIHDQFCIENQIFST